jgi:alpha-tubulin suppressor-like RCC1 family protein
VNTLALWTCVGLSGAWGCGRLQFESVDASARDGSMDAGDAEIADANPDAPDSSIDATGDGAPDDAGGPPAIHVIPNETLLDTGALHSCAGLFGRLYCWGDNTFGQLGDGTTQDRSAPVRLMTIANVVDLQLGDDHSCALTRIGAVYCWGHNPHGELGDGTTLDRAQPTLVSGLDLGVQALWVGAFHACARNADDAIVCWGLNDHGQLGDGTTLDRRQPVVMTALNDATDLALGADMTCALKANRVVTCIGANGDGQLGRGSSGATDQLSEMPVAGVSDVRSLAAGHHHVCAELGDGSGRCWGRNTRFQCGNDTVSPREPTAVEVVLLDAVRQAAAAQHTSCVVDETGLAKCWGGSVAGNTTDRRVPTVIAGLDDVREIHAGRDHQCMRAANNYIHCAGSNAEGQLGDGTRQTSTSAVQVLGLPAPVSGPNPRCGDRFLNGTLGVETCDDGQNTARCNADCTLSRCGDGIVNPLAGETCETGGDLDAGGCNPDCTLP